MNGLLSHEEKEICVREHVDREIVPGMAGYWDRAEFPFDLVPGFGELGIMGGAFEKEYGCAGWSNVGPVPWRRPPAEKDGGYVLQGEMAPVVEHFPLQQN
jgi:hypothetical protein